MLAMVQAITIQSLRSAKTLAGAEEAVQNRIMALARTHDVLLQYNDDAAQFKTVLTAAVGAFEGNGRISIAAPTFDLPSSMALSISVVINELCTNAVKFGALSTPAGHVELTGAINDAGDVITMTWLESGGPPVQESAERGFGTQLIKSATAGDVHLEFKSGGVLCEITLPVEHRA
jgi:two-component sensor histidine kinase